MNTKTPDEYREERRTAHAERYATGIARARAIVAQTTADFCSHGVDRRICVDHRPAKSSDGAA